MSATFKVDTAGVVTPADTEPQWLVVAFDSATNGVLTTTAVSGDELDAHRLAAQMNARGRSYGVGGLLDYRVVAL